MTTVLCDQCGAVCHGVPWVAMRKGAYALLCSTQCKTSYENETHRIAWTQGMLALGTAVFNGS